MAAASFSRVLPKMQGFVCFCLSLVGLVNLCIWAHGVPCSPGLPDGLQKSCDFVVYPAFFFSYSVLCPFISEVEAEIQEPTEEVNRMLGWLSKGWKQHNEGA